ncbi:glutathione-disulfide reductase [Dolosicoccus paucivorans]
MTQYDYDLIVLGGGSGGIATANRAAEYGAKVAVIEEDLLGGTCVNRGCVPKKATWYAARVAEAIHNYSSSYGFNVGDISFDYQKFLESRDGYVSRSRGSYTTRFDKNGVEVIEGKGYIENPHEISVDGKTYSTNYMMIATGGRPRPLPIPGGELADNSDDFFNWETLPESVLIIGSGYIAVELGGALAALGVKTTLSIRSERVLRSFDHMLSDELMPMMEKQGIELLTHHHIDELRQKGDQIEVIVNGEVERVVDRVIAAIGRDLNTENIGLENTKVQLDNKGFIDLVEGHQTHEENIYAVGDVAQPIALTPVAIRAGRQTAEYLFNNAPTSAIDYTNIPTVIFSHPAIGTIGLSEEEAIAKCGEDQIKVYTNLFFSMYASVGGGRERNKFKLVTLGEDEKVIGLHGIGEGVDEMFQGFGVAIKMGATKADLDSVVAIHPTGSEEFVTMR